MSHDKRISILVVEDHSLARMALRTVINTQTDMTVVAEAETGEQAIELHRHHQPDVTIMDLRIPGINGLDALTAIRKETLAARVIVLTNYEGSEDVYRCLQAGAQSYLLKNTRAEELLRAIRAVSRGERYIPQIIGTRLAERLPVAELTARELDVLRLIVKGMSNKEIAQDLKIAEKTVSIHVSSILGKMQVSDRTQAAVAALRRGYVHPE